MPKYVSVLSVLILEKIYEVLIHKNKRNCSIYQGVCIKRVSIERGSTVFHLANIALFSHQSYKKLAINA